MNRFRQQYARLPRPLRRLGCLVGILIWALLVLSPCALFFFATQNEVNIALGALPEQNLRIWLINEPRERGFAVAVPILVEGPDPDSICLQTETRFLLWMGQGEPGTICDCYTSSSDEGWHLISSSIGACRT